MKQLSDIRIGVFAYNFPHKKTNDFIFRMLSEAIPIELILAADPVELPIAPPSVKTKIRHQEVLHPRMIADNFKINFHVCQHNSQEAINYIKKYDLDVGIIAGARILKEPVINAFKLGVINFHPGL